MGDPAADFDLPSSTGETVRLSDFRGQSEVVLFFYPKDNSPACTMEACSFRDSHEAFREAGAEVIGISSDSADSHRRFADRFRLPFLLLADTRRSRPGAVRRPPHPRPVPGPGHLPDRPRRHRPPYLLVAVPALAACPRGAPDPRRTEALNDRPEAAGRSDPQGTLGPVAAFWPT